MTLNLGDQPVDTTIFIPFDSFGADGESLVISGLLTSDVKIYKDGSITQRTGVAGITLLDTDGISFDGIVGVNGISIALANNDDAGFYAADSSYFVVIDEVTINTQSVSFIAASWTIEIANGAIALAKIAAGINTESRLAEMDAGNLPTDIAAIPTTAMRGTDSAALATAWTATRAGYVDELAAANLPTDIAAIPTTAMRGTDGAADLTDQATMQSAIDAIPTTAMRGTDSAATEAKQNAQDAIITEARLAELDAANLPSDVDDIKTQTDKLGTAMPESVAADGSVNTPIQALYLLGQIATEMSISGTTMTIKKVNGTTTLIEITLNDDTTPTSKTRSA